MTDGFTEAQQDLGIVNLHLVSGEDIIGKVFKKTDPDTNAESYVILKPVTPIQQMAQTPNGPRIGVGLLPLRPWLDGLPELDLPTVYVLYAVKVTRQMEKMYFEFTSGISLADAGSVPNLHI